MARRRRTAASVAKVEHELVFDTWDEYVAFAAQPSKWREPTEPTGAGPRSGPRPYNGNCTWDEAVHMARYGWQEGRENLAQAIAIARPERAIVQSTSRDVAGDYPLIPAAVAGDPMNMIVRRRSQVAARPVVRIDYNGSVSGKLDASRIVNRGAALLSIVDAMEARGYSCELRIIFKTWNAAQRLSVAVTYKRAGEPLDIDRAAFALIHPATMRRLFLGCIEQFPEFERNFSPAHEWAYGYPDTTPWGDDPASIYIDGATNDDFSPEAARERMERHFAEYLES